MTLITSKITGERVEINRCATAINPPWVYHQTETSSQSELDAMLDGYNVENYYQGSTHLGPDFLGIELIRDDN